MSTPPTLARRDLLRGTAALAAGSALGLLPSFASAVLIAPALAFGVWNGRRFVPVKGATLDLARYERVRLTVTSVAGGGFAALDAHAPLARGGRSPFVLWVAPPAGLPRHRTAVATEAEGGLVFVAYAKDGVRHEVAIPGPALTAGSYVLAPGDASLREFRLDAEDAAKPLGLAPHVRIDVEPV